MCKETSMKVYKALKKELPGKSNVAIGSIIGMQHSTLTKLRKGNGLGVAGAKWLSENRDGYDELYQTVLRALSTAKKAGAKRGAKSRHREPGFTSNRVKKLSPDMQAFCGRIPDECHE